MGNCAFSTPSQKKYERILVLGARAPASLEWIRALVAAGKTVIVADSLCLPVSRGAKGIRSFYKLPSPRLDPNAWGRALYEIVTKNSVDLILPTCEEVFYLAHQRERFDDSCKVFTMPFATLHTIHHKGEFAAHTMTMPIEAPRTFVLSSVNDRDRFLADSKSWVFKPAYSRFASRTLIRPRDFELERVTPTVSFPWVAQEWIDGRELCTYSVLVDGKVAAHACYHPKYRVGVGSGIFFEPVRAQLIRSFVESFGKKFDYTGQVGFDFIEGRDGKFFVLECNPRATSGIHLFGNKRNELVKALSGGIESHTADALGQCFTVGLCMGVFGIPRYGNHFQFWKDWRSANDVIISLRDPIPFLTQISGLGEIALKALIQRVSLVSAATSDIEWDGEALGDYQV